MRRKYGTAEVFDDFYRFMELSLDEPRGASIDYENPNEVSELVVWHLAKNFWTTHKGKVAREVEINDSLVF